MTGYRVRSGIGRTKNIPDFADRLSEMVRFCLLFTIMQGISLTTLAAPNEKCNSLQVSSYSWSQVFQPATDKSPASGPGWKLLKAIQRELAVDVELLHAEPFAREIHLLKSGDRDALISLYPLPERRAFFEFTTPYFAEPLYIYSHSDNHLKVTNLHDLDGLTGSLIRGSSLGLQLDDYFARHPSLIFINHKHQHITLLMARRTDFYINSPVTSTKLIAELQAAHLIKRSRHPIAWADVAMAFSLRSPCRKLVPAINRLISQLFLPLDSSAMTLNPATPLQVGRRN